MSSPPWRDFPGARCDLCNIPEPESFDSGRAKPGLGQGFVAHSGARNRKILDAGYLILDETRNVFSVLSSIQHRLASPARTGPGRASKEILPPSTHRFEAEHRYLIYVFYMRSQREFMIPGCHFLLKDI